LIDARGDLTIFHMRRLRICEQLGDAKDLVGCRLAVLDAMSALMVIVDRPPSREMDFFFKMYIRPRFNRPDSIPSELASLGSDDLSRVDKYALEALYEGVANAAWADVEGSNVEDRATRLAHYHFAMSVRAAARLDWRGAVAELEWVLEVIPKGEISNLAAVESDLADALIALGEYDRAARTCHSAIRKCGVLGLHTRLSQLFAHFRRGWRIAMRQCKPSACG
jgi:hypothetical protein